MGSLNVELTDTTTVVDHNRLVWQTPKEMKNNKCTLNTIFRSRGNITLTQGQGRLVDPKNQIEVLFDSKPVKVCNETVYQVKGVPKTFLLIPDLPTNKTNKTIQNPVVRQRRHGTVMVIESCDEAEESTETTNSFEARDESIPSTFFKNNNHNNQKVTETNMTRQATTMSVSKIVGLKEYLDSYMTNTSKTLKVNAMNVQGLGEMFLSSELNLIEFVKTTEPPTLKERVSNTIEVMHEQYKEGLEIEHENRLAQEIRDVYCQFATF